MQKILHPPLTLYAYNIQTVQGLELGNQPGWKEFAVDIPRQTDNDSTFLDNSESTFHVSSILNRQLQNLGSENACVVCKCNNDRPKLRLLAVLQVAHFQLKGFFQQGGAPPHWSLVV